MQRILVTGGAGFIGSHTVDLLLQQGKDVVVLDNLFSGKLTNLNLSHPNLEFIEGDILEYPLVEELVANCDGVLHLAAVTSVNHSIENPIYSFQVNTQGFLHVIEAIRQVKSKRRFVYASSAAIYGDAAALPCRDDQALSATALSPYALQKINNEQYAHLYATLYQVKSLGLRYFNVYGERQDPNSPYSGVISRFLDAYQKNAETVIFGDGQQTRDFIYVQDVAKANTLALGSDYAGHLNIATGKPHSLLELNQFIENAGGKPLAYVFDAARSGDIRESYAEITHAADKLAFRANVSLQEGIKLLVK